MLGALRSVLLGAAVLASGCALAACGDGQQVVFADSTGSGEGLRGATTVDIVDVGLSLHNLTGHSVRVLGVRLVSAPRPVRLLAVSAYPASLALGIGRGDLLKLCRTTDPAHQVTDAITAPNADSSWMLVLAIRFAEPGRYSLGLSRISYTTNGHKGWQYEHLNATVTVTAASPSAKPEFDGC